MTRRDYLFSIIALLLALTASPSALAQCSGQAPASTFCGNNGVTLGLPSWVSLSAVLPNIGGGTIYGNRGTTTAAPSGITNPVLGIPGTSTGQIGFAGAVSGTVTIKPGATAAGTYNFNLPTDAGASGQPMLSGGGGSAAMTFGTLGLAGGGTGATTAAGARSSLGLGTIATQNASSVAISGGSITGTSFNASGTTITNVPTPSAAGDAASKAYVDSVGSGFNPVAASLLATAAVLPNSPTYSNGASGVGATLTAGSNTTLTVDGTAVALNDVVLVKNQAAPAQNGIYTLTQLGSGAAPWILTRATYFDTAAEMLNNSTTAITAGSANVGQTWVMSPAVTTVGTTASTWVLFSGSTSGVTVGTTTVGGGTTTRVLYDNAGVLGEYQITGTGKVVMDTSPTIASPTFSGTVAGANTVPNSVLAQGGAATLKGNPTSSTANVQDFTIQGLTARGTPGAADKLPIYDNSAGTIKYVLPADIINSQTIANNRVLANVSGGTATPTGTSGTSLFDSIYCNTVGYVIARTLSAWTCSNAFPINMAWMGADGTGAVSASTLFATAAATGKNIYWPKPSSCYLLTADVQLTGAQEVFGDGRGVPTFCVTSNAGFTNGVIKCSGSQPGNTIRDLMVQFTQAEPTPAASTTGTISGTSLTVASGTGIAIGQVVGPAGSVQPNVTIASGSGTSWTLTFAPTAYTGPITTYVVSTIRSQLTAYKPFLYCQDSARVSVRHVLVQEAWDFADFRGNSGGLEMLDVQFSAYNKGIQIDGSLDSIRLTDIHCWPFGIGSGTTKYGALTQTPVAGSTSGAMCFSIGRVDGMTMTNVTTAQQLGLYMFYGTFATAGDAGITCTGCNFDTFNGGVQTSGNFKMVGGGIGLQTGVTGWVMETTGGGTKTSAWFGNVAMGGQTYGSYIQMQNCTLCTLNMDQLYFTGAVNSVVFAGVSASVVNSNIWLSNSYFTEFPVAMEVVSAFAPTTAGVNNFHIVNNIFQTSPNVAYTNPLINILGNCGTQVNRAYIAGNRFIDKGTGAGTAILKQCSQYDVISQNIAPGWTYTLPAATCTSAACYTGNLN